MSIFRDLMAWAFRVGQVADLCGHGDGCLPSGHPQLAADICYMEVDCAFCDSQDGSDFPAAFALGNPVETMFFTRGQISIHRNHQDIYNKILLNNTKLFSY